MCQQRSRGHSGGIDHSFRLSDGGYCRKGVAAAVAAKAATNYLPTSLRNKFIHCKTLSILLNYNCLILSLYFEASATLSQVIFFNKDLGAYMVEVSGKCGCLTAIKLWVQTHLIHKWKYHFTADLLYDWR